ncbi:hypothetical protein [Cohnella silvisoli]|uniref:Glycogen debranching protein n=1 Tax=Cohnella silvisoli TaxID=2873699 RepID=A0ABV1L3L0_9BACL|nr:hypothetical protein [Cohnella silvisoli]MCD9025697.1 hypothetical protein [Cohnella silvisoli]
MVTLSDFARDINRIAHKNDHVRVGSGRVACGYLPQSVTGVGRIFCPPISAGELAFSLQFELPDKEITISDSALTGHGIPRQLLLQEEIWHPSFIQRKGHFHHTDAEGQLVSFMLETLLVPSVTDDSVLLRVKLTNRLTSPLSGSVRINWTKCCAKLAKPSEWAWGAPSDELQLQPQVPGLYEGGGVRLETLWSSSSPGGPAPNDRESKSVRLIGDGMDWSCEAEGDVSFVLQVRLSIPNHSLTHDGQNTDSNALPDSHCLFEHVEYTLQLREQSWHDFWRSMPHLEADHSGLVKAYRHAALTLFLCIWDSPHLAVRPHIAEAGLNGGALCNYLWGEAYASKLLALSLGSDWKPTLRAHLNMGIEAHYAFEPISGQGVGPFYSYNGFSLVQAVVEYVRWTEDVSLLSEVDENGVAFVERLANSLDRFEACFEEPIPGLLDFGDHHHLLEMRSKGYEHIVPSPNSERVVTYQRLAELLETVDAPRAEIYRRKASETTAAVQLNLWNEQDGWMDSIYPNGTREQVYSIQIFDIIDTGILSSDQIRRIISRLNEREFLSQYGVHSISKSDALHYDTGDVDWSGAGCYVGDPANSAETLFRLGEADLGWDVMRRLLWWADAYPYWPQSIWASKPAYSHWEQPIDRSAFAFAQAVVFGMCGLTLEQGKPLFKPQLPDGIGRIHLTNVKVHGQILSFEGSA